MYSTVAFSQLPSSWSARSTNSASLGSGRSDSGRGRAAAANADYVAATVASERYESRPGPPTSMSPDVLRAVGVGELMRIPATAVLQSPGTQAVVMSRTAVQHCGPDGRRALFADRKSWPGPTVDARPARPELIVSRGHRRHGRPPAHVVERRCRHRSRRRRPPLEEDKAVREGEPVAQLAGRREVNGAMPLTSVEPVDLWQPGPTWSGLQRLRGLQQMRRCGGSADAVRP